MLVALARLIYDMSRLANWLNKQPLRTMESTSAKTIVPYQRVMNVRSPSVACANFTSMLVTSDEFHIRSVRCVDHVTIDTTTLKWYPPTCVAQVMRKIFITRFQGIDQLLSFA